MKTAVKALPILLSASALSLSGWSLYYKDVADRDRLIATSTEFNVPLLPATEDDDRFRGTGEGKLLLSNGGNRSGALLSSRVWLVSQRLEESRPRSELCDGRRLPGAIGVALESSNLPVIVDPGKIAAIDYKLNFDFGWDEMKFNRNVETCIEFSVMDSRGVERTKTFPFVWIGFHKEDDPKVGPGFSLPERPFTLMR